MKENSILKYSAPILIIPAIYTSFFPGKIIAITALCLYPLLILLWRYYFQLKNNELSSIKLIRLYIIVNVIIFIRGVFDLSTSQDFTVTFGNMIFTTLMFPLYIFAVKRSNLINIIRGILWLAIPLSFISYFFPPTNGFMSFQHNVSVVYLFIFFIPFVSRKWKIAILLLALMGVSFDFTRRSFSINLIVSSIVLLGYYALSERKFNIISKISFYILVLSPALFVYLGVSGIYNIFKIGEDFDNIIVQSESNTRNVLVDSRTPIYVDVYSELSRRNAILWGLGGNGKTKTSLTEVVHSNFAAIYKEGRRSTESGMLNYFQWGGLIASISYWCLLAFASYSAISKSRNSLIKMLGLFMAFKVLYSFIEDTINIQVSSFYLMIMIGICYNKYIRNLNNKQISIISHSIFNLKTPKIAGN